MSTIRTPLRAAPGGFTLLELLVVLAIVAIATAGAGLALRDPERQALQRDAERLAAVLEAARALARGSGQPLRWMPQGEGFQVIGADPPRPAQRWLNQGVQAEAAGRRELLLGPEPILEAQSVTLRLGQARLRVASDGLRPFAVQPP